jgi:MOSC domain-containing protein YiiM
VIKGYRGVSAQGNLEFGVYAEVLEPGTVRVGDGVELV